MESIPSKDTEENTDVKRVATGDETCVMADPGVIVPGANVLGPNVPGANVANANVANANVPLSGTTVKAKLVHLGKVRKNTDQPIRADLPLHDNKTAHLFVSYSSEDEHIVLPIILDLEQNFGFICHFDGRDFIEGKAIYENIQHGMEKSMKILLFLSENFLRSGYCKYETGLAFVTSMERGGNNVIPVMLEDCRVPSSLRTLTYVDAWKEGSNLAETILDAYKHTDTDVLPTHLRYNPDLAGKPENGESVRFDCVVEKSCCLRPAKKYIQMDAVTRLNISEGKYPITDDNLQGVVDFVNSYYSNSLLAKADPFVLVGLALCYLPFVSVLAVIATGAIYLSKLTQTTDEPAEDYLLTSSAIVVVFLPTVGTLLVVLSLWVGSSLQRNWSFRRLSRQLFERITRETYREGVLFEIQDAPPGPSNNHRRSIVLRMIRYDMAPCKTYLEERIRTIQESPSDGAELQEYRPVEDAVEALLTNHLQEYCDKFSSLSDAPVTRHRVKGGKTCFCQVAEKHVAAYLYRGGAGRVAPV